MSAAVVTRGVRDVRLVVDHRQPAPPPLTHVVVEVGVVGLCGTDFHIADGSYAPPRLPLVQGHEFAGTVALLPPGYTGPLALKDKVAVDPVRACGACSSCAGGRSNICRDFQSLGVHLDGALQQLVAVPAAACHPIGDLPLSLGALCEPVSVSLRALERSHARAGQPLVVLGCGPIGLGVVAAAEARGLRVYAGDRHPERAELAVRLGADHAVADMDDLAPLIAATAGRGAPAVIDATGSAAMLTRAFQLVAPGGTICVVGVGSDDAVVPYRNLTRDEVTVTGSRATGDFPGAVRFVREHRTRLAQLVTATLGMQDAAEALSGRAPRPRSGKLQVDVGGSAAGALAPS